MICGDLLAKKLTDQLRFSEHIMDEEKKKKRKSTDFDQRDIEDYVKIARQLGYSQDVIISIRRAKSHIQCDQIMKSARNATS